MTKWSAFIIFIMRSINELMTILSILKPPKKKFFAVWGIYYCLCSFQNYFQLTVYLTINKCDGDWTLFSDRFELYELLVRPVEESIWNWWKLNKLNFERNSKCLKVFWLYYLANIFLEKEFRKKLSYLKKIKHILLWILPFSFVVFV